MGFRFPRSTLGSSAPLTKREVKTARPSQPTPPPFLGGNRPSAAPVKGGLTPMLSLLLLLLLSACSRPDTDATAPTPAPTQTQTVDTARAVRTITAERGPLNATRNASVTVEPLQESRVAAGTGGRVERILKREGETVATGEAVIALDDAALRLQVQNAQLAVESARISLDKAQRSSGENGTQLAQQLQSAQTSFDIAQRQFTEGQALYSAGGISSSDLSNSQAQLSQAQAALTGAQDAVARSSRSGSEDLALLRVAVNQAQTSLSQAEDALNEAQVTAPFAGEVAEVLVEEGEFIGAGSPAFRLVSTGRQLGRFSVPPQDAQKLLSQDPLYFRYGGLDYAAHVVRSSTAPGDSRLIDITAEIYPSETPIPAGSVAQINYTVALGAGVQVPSGALQTAVGNTYVFVVEGESAVRKEVQVVAEASGETVVEGLDEGAQVVFPLPADLRDGVDVKVVGS